MTAGGDEKWHMLIPARARQTSWEAEGNNGETLEESGGSVCTHHRRNEGNMLIAESSAGGKIKGDKHHFCRSPLMRTVESDTGGELVRKSRLLLGAGGHHLRSSVTCG